MGTAVQGAVQGCLDDVAALQPEDFAVPSESLSERLKHVTKELFDLGKRHDSHQFSMLDELYVKGFDLEQIWEQLQLHNGPLIKHLEKRVRALVAHPQEIDLLPEEAEAEEEPPGQGEDLASEEEGEKEKEEHGGGPTGADGNLGRLPRAERAAAPHASGRAVHGHIPESVEVLLDDMDEFVEQAERQQILRDDDEDIDDDIDEDDDDEEEEEEEGEGEEWRGAALFGSGSRGKATKAGHLRSKGDGEVEQEDDEEAASPAMHGKGAEHREADGDADEEVDGEDGGAEGDGEEDADQHALDLQAAGEESGTAILSAHELRLKRLQEKIAVLEQANVADKPWHLRGEVSAADRPLNSLLEEHIDFEAAARPAPTITQQVTQTIEDVIKARILQGVFDDVERKAAPDVSMLRPRQLELSQEKSKRGLAAEYEEEYKKLAMSIQPDSGPGKLHAEIGALFDRLCAQLDALSSFHFKPKPAEAPEVEVRPNVPALQMEEPMPTAVSFAQSLAPREVKAPQGVQDLATNVELSSRERKARRNAMKHRAQREKRRRMSTEQQTPSAVRQLERELDVAKKSRTARVVTGKVAGEDSRGLTRSSHFFSKLQDRQSTGLPGKVPGKKAAEERRRTAATAPSLKL